MGKSTKKSSVTVDAAVVPAPEKPLKKGKRKAEDAIEKEVVKDKKQKAEVTVLKKVENSAKEVKAAKNGHVESESEESSGLDEAVVAPKKSVTPAKKETVAAAKKKQESSSDSESSSEDESSSDEDVAAAQNGTKAPAKKEDESSDDSSSEDDSPVAKKVPAKKDESSDDSESEDESSSDEDEAPKEVVPATKNGTQKKDESSSDESDSEDDSSSEDDIATKKVPAAAKKKDESSEESESDDESSDDEDPKATSQKVTAAPNKSKQDDSDDDSEDESSEASEDEEPQKKNVKVPVTNKKSSSEESSDEDEDDSSEDEEKPSKTPKKTDSDVKMTDVASATPKTPVTPKSQSNGSKTLFVGNLPFSVEQADVENFFKDVGEVVDVRFAVRKEDNSFKGFGHVEFATAEQAEKALKELNGQELLGRALRLDLALERGAYTPYSGGQDSQSFQKGGRSQGQSLFVRGFDKNASEDQIRSSLEQFFGSCGEVTRVSIPTQDGVVKGIAYVQFSDNNAINQALELNGSELEGSYLTVEQARPRDSDGSGRRDGGYGSGGRRGGRFGSDGGGGRRGGRFGGDGGGRFGGDGGGRRGGGRFVGGGGNRGRGTPYSKPSMGAAATGKKTTFGDD